ncbi:MAG TPA: Hsp20/alpha crystallin family protein [Gammaproteobacteria bacterium]|nr:Hsp20/alpha crystallin family protein [Gammaproteobacteria bacterium]
MLKMSDVANSLNRTWESLGEGWNHLVNRAGKALTHFRAGEGAKGEAPPVASPQWGLLSADVFDDADKVIVKLEAPGLEADDFDINVVENTLIVSGEKRFEREEKKGEYRLLERAYGRFSRSIPLGYEVDVDSAKARYKKGVLTVELEKKPDQRRRHIKVV